MKNGVDLVLVLRCIFWKRTYNRASHQQMSFQMEPKYNNDEESMDSWYATSAPHNPQLSHASIWKGKHFPPSVPRGFAFVDVRRSRQPPRLAQESGLRLLAYRPAAITAKMSSHVSGAQVARSNTRAWQRQCTRRNKCHAALLIWSRWLRNNRPILFHVSVRVWVCTVISWDGDGGRDGGLLGSVIASSSGCSCMFVWGWNPFIKVVSTPFVSVLGPVFHL